MVVFGIICMLFFCAALTFMIMTVIIGMTNIQEEEKDPVQFLMGNISYEHNEEFGMDYQEKIPRFITRYGFDHEAFPDE
ncbi:MAG: hypothetical protein J5883_00590 [Clostridiales bacterium]|nr:hypothetical protein [Clostridiales bacterium]